MFMNRCSVETQKYDITVRRTISVKLSLEMVYRLVLWMQSSGMSSSDSYWLYRLVSNSCGCRFDPCDELDSIFRLSRWFSLLLKLYLWNEEGREFGTACVGFGVSCCII